VRREQRKQGVCERVARRGREGARREGDQRERVERGSEERGGESG